MRHLQKTSENFDALDELEYGISVQQIKVYNNIIWSTKYAVKIFQLLFWIQFQIFPIHDIWVFIYEINLYKYLKNQAKNLT